MCLIMNIIYVTNMEGKLKRQINAVSHEILKEQTRTKLQYQYINDTRKLRLEESSKLKFYYREK